MNDFEVSRNISMPVRGAIIVMLVLAFIVAFIPLWQMGESISGPAVTASEVSGEDSPAAYRALRAAIAASTPYDSEAIASDSYQS